MAHKIKTRKTAEERRTEANALQERITEQVEQLRETDAWQQFLDFATAFHNYSLNNLMLILAQRPEATHVAGFRKWQQLGRQVRKGESSLKIFGYAERKATEEENDGTLQKNAEGEPVMPYFPTLSVFDITQTDPTDEWTEPTIAPQLEGDDPTGIYAAAHDYITAEGWNVTRKPIPGEANGFTRIDGSRAIVVDDALSDAQAAKTLLHEIAHALMHEAGGIEDYIAHRGKAETEAESVAYIVAGILGLDTSSYSIGYVAGWSNADTNTIKTTATNVLRTAHKIANALTSAD